MWRLAAIRGSFIRWPCVTDPITLQYIMISNHNNLTSDTVDDQNPALP